MPCPYILDCMPDLIRVQIRALIIIFFVVIMVIIIVVVIIIVMSAVLPIVILLMVIVSIISPVLATVGAAAILTGVDGRCGLGDGGLAHDRRRDGRVAAYTGGRLKRRARQPFRLQLRSGGNRRRQQPRNLGALHRGVRESGKRPCTGPRACAQSGLRRAGCRHPGLTEDQRDQAGDRHDQRRDHSQRR